MMKNLLLILFLLPGILSFAQNKDEAFIKNISDEILTNGKAYDNLRVLTKTIGARLAGSPGMYKAEDWGYNTLKNSGSDNTFKQQCMVPHWVRGGKDEAFALLPGNKKKALDIVALGNTVGTKLNGLTASVLLVNSFADLETKKDQVKGKIVFYNYKFKPTFIRTFSSYGDAVKYRGRMGTSSAAKYGAVATIIRSMSHSVDNNPHTGATGYDTAYTANPAVAVGLLDADWLANALSQNSQMKIYLRTNGHFLPDTVGHNIIGELKGTEFPDEYITLGGHLDSWDNCEGAHDDGAGIVQTIEVMRALKALGYKPKHTLRFVLFANEENGTRGGNKYAANAKENNEKHILAIETDAGGFTPRGFSFHCSEEQFKKIKTWEPLLNPYGAGDFEMGGGGTDIEPLNRKLGVPMAELLPDSQRYFDLHHSRGDTFETVNKRELELGAINIAAIIYLIDQYGL